MFKASLGLAACITAAGLAYAAVIVDDQGVGFVGKGDVQLSMDWNNAQLQGNAGLIRFQLRSTGTSSWECEKEVVENGKSGKVSKPVTQTKETTSSVDSTIAYDARKNNKGQITGFNLNGISSVTTVTTGDAIGECAADSSNPNEGKWTLVEGSIETTEGDSVLEVSGDGGVTFVALPITQ